MHLQHGAAHKHDATHKIKIKHDLLTVSDVAEICHTRVRNYVQWGEKIKWIN